MFDFVRKRKNMEVKLCLYQKHGLSGVFLLLFGLSWINSGISKGITAGPALPPHSEDLEIIDVAESLLEQIEKIFEVSYVIKYQSNCNNSVKAQCTRNSTSINARKSK